MRETESTLERYRRADFGTRLYMLLDHRDLRPWFEQIEAEEETERGEVALPFPAWWETLSRPVRRVLRGCCARGA